LFNTDVLVDGQYEANLPDHSRLWIGSTNQQYHYLSSRYDPRIEKDEAVERAIEVHIGSNGSVFVNGWPEKIYLK
jgi:anaerobic ribonucleoside-triphosphate reductase activating protein